VPTGDDREDDEAGAEGNLRAAAAGRDEMEETEDRQSHGERMPRDPIHAPGRCVARNETRGTRVHEARHQQHEGKPNAGVHDPARRYSPLGDPQPRVPRLVGEEGPHERHKEGESDKGIERSERRLPDASDDPVSDGQGREPDVRGGEADPQQQNACGRGHASLRSRRRRAARDDSLGDQAALKPLVEPFPRLTHRRDSSPEQQARDRPHLGTATVSRRRRDQVRSSEPARKNRQRPERHPGCERQDDDADEPSDRTRS